ncbi:hypothetical protein [Novipirellula artificiosorum]|nr:hypothetical protein [Novipirellula artificiosorum]
MQLRTTEGVPLISVLPDLTKPVLSVDIFYTQQGQIDGEKDDRNNTTARFWHHVAGTSNGGGDGWTGKLPLLSTDKPLWVYANVTYALKETVTAAGYYFNTYSTDVFNLSSLMWMVSPEQLQESGVESTRQPSHRIESFEGDWQKEWYSYKSDAWPRQTHKLHDPQWAAPKDAQLAIDVQSDKPNSFVIGLDDFAAEVELTGGADWQTILLAAADFKDAKGNALTDWQGIKELRLGDQETLKDDDHRHVLGDRWQGDPPKLRDLRWIDLAAEQGPSAGSAASAIRSDVSDSSLVAQHNMTWGRVPHRWQVWLDIESVKGRMK